jgi:hypothetical protein
MSPFKYPEVGFRFFRFSDFASRLHAGLSFVERDPDEGKRVVQNEDNCMAQHQIMNYRHNNKNGAHTRTFTLVRE